MTGEFDALAQAAGIELTSAQSDALTRYLDLLRRWNGTYNLTAVRDRAAMRVQHLADCLAAVPAVARAMAHRGGAQRLLDVGSGGGLPGVVIAVLLPSVNVVCVDAVGKKAAFIRQVAAALQLPNLHGQHARVEALGAPPFDVIVSRAFASLADFVGLTKPLLAPGGCWMAMKGRPPDAEIAALPKDVEMFHVEQLVVPQLDAERCLVWMRAAEAPAAI